MSADRVAISIDQLDAGRRVHSLARGALVGVTELAPTVEGALMALVVAADSAVQSYVGIGDHVPTETRAVMGALIERRLTGILTAARGLRQ